MKKIIIAIIAPVLIAIPFFVYTLSFDNALDYGKGVITEIDNIENPENDLMKDNKEALERDKAAVKYERWKKAFKDKSLISLYDDEDNFIFSEKDLNYIALWSLQEQDAPIVKEVSIDLTSQGVLVKGYSNLKNLKGDFELLLETKKEKGRIFLKVVKAKLKGFPFPAFMASGAVHNQVIDFVNFLYIEEGRNWNVFVNEDYLRLEY